ncbi:MULTISPECIES: bifunctional 2-polyprenyl-6-hydroxyphenol methylase/3-demethylubiquinol 3-O-methyltransferase UbiG [unclassified Leeuwenhoekiella]|uniref:class I SAM-dependent methyltransferase n=1 Tax=unclassified Leeuwenhoekiella TaxID=2615029 RepID=UPI000C59BDE4|nr:MULTISPECIES: class I SAM-dependent methyltransferase [unclassified Leeuwenhoekiella]MAW96736.1 SAM-dependent methyltransferase [Leeuwenhoekiella sp.]MBA81625.1 SAM-dependent methyltransferase [Leeuwenhoekiella sp.]|tara:strand:+ start:19898 stop:20626 length:729 start_codon:yes stop_codon:yes gene_type:complete
MAKKDSVNPDVFGAALLDFYNGKYSEDITVISSLTEDDEIPVPYLFRDYAKMPEIEQKALQLATGKILDVGACAGSHSLYLQQQGLDVSALDVSAGAIEVCRLRGIEKALQADVFELSEASYDTLLLLMNGTGIFKTLKNTQPALKHLASLLNTNGQILVDSSDIAFMYEEEDGSYWRDVNSNYYGEVTFQIQYKGKISNAFDWLYLDFKTLKAEAEKAGFFCEKILDGPHYEYLARLVKVD